jgi:hypothetical protein
LWHELWRVLNTRCGSVVFHKIKSHQDGSPLADAELGLPVWANEVADGLAGLAAKKFQPPINQCENIKWYDSICRAVLLRGLSLLEWLHDHKKEVDQLEETVRIPLEEQAALSQETRVNQAHEWGHLVTLEDGQFSCRQCGLSSPGRVRPWERQECIPPGPWQGAHGSHIPHLTTVGSTTVCLKCGKYSTRGIRSFKRECRPPTASGRLVLRLAAAAREPYGVVRQKRLRRTERATARGVELPP